VRTGHGDQLYDYEKTAATDPNWQAMPEQACRLSSRVLKGCCLRCCHSCPKESVLGIFCLNIALRFMIFRLLTPARAWMRETWAALPAMVVAGFSAGRASGLFHGQDSILFLFIHRCRIRVAE